LPVDELSKFAYSLSALAKIVADETLENRISRIERALNAVVEEEHE